MHAKVRRYRANGSYTTHIVTRAVVTRYVYVPIEDAMAFVKWCPSMYQPRMLYSQSGSSSLALTNKEDEKVPASVTLAELKQHAHAIRQISTPADLEDKVSMQAGDKVKFNMGTVEVEGFICSFNKGRSARVRANGIFVNVKLDNLTRI